MFYSQAVRLDIQGSMNNIAFFTIESLALAASTYGSVYSLPVPRSQDGLYVLQWPYVRLQITNTAGADTVTQRCYAVLQNYR